MRIEKVTDRATGKERWIVWVGRKVVAEGWASEMRGALCFG